MRPRTRHILAALAVSAVLPSAAAAAPPSVALDNGIPAYPGGWVKGPDAPVYFTVGWSPSSTARTVEVTAGPARAVLSNPFLRNAESVVLRGLANGAEYDLTLLATQTAPGFLGVPTTERSILVRHIRIDSIAPYEPYVTVNGGNPYTNRYSIALNVAAGGDQRMSGTRSMEVRLSEAAFGACEDRPNADGTGCYLFDRSSINNTTVTLAPGPDGPRKVWVRTRDAAAVSCQSPGAVFSVCQPLANGNISPPGIGPSTVLLDTTAPVAAMTGSAPTGTAGTPVRLDATPSSDPNGASGSGINPAAFRWDYGDGSPVETGRPGAVTHLYPGPGTYRGEVRATDRAGNAGALRFTVVVNPAPAPGDPVPDPGTTPPPDPTPSTPATTTGATPVPPPAGSVVPPSGRPVPPAPRIRGLVFDPDRGIVVRVSTAGVLRINVTTPTGRRITAVSKRVTAGENVIAPWRGLIVRLRQRPRGDIRIGAQLIASGLRTPVRTIGVPKSTVLQAAGA